MLFNTIKIRDIMTKNPKTVYEDELFSHVEKQFSSHSIRHLPVIDKSKKLKGLITQRDLYRIISPRRDFEGNIFYDTRDLDKYILKHVMIKDVFTMTGDHTVIEAVSAMVRHKYGCIPITGDELSLEGIITQIDILRALENHFV